MEITKVGYSALLNLGNYRNEKISFIAKVDENESPEQVVEKLRERVKAVGGKNADDMYYELREGTKQLAELDRKIAKATSEWNAVSEFLRKQGIKPDAVDMPKFNHLLPEVKEESTEVIDGEIEDEDEDEDDSY